MSPEQMAKTVEPHATVSDKIRALAAAGVARADIARFLGKRYQHVRNVLEADAATGTGSRPIEFARVRAEIVKESGAREEGRMFESSGESRKEWRGDGSFRLVVGPDGSIILPAPVREALQVTSRGVVVGQLSQDGFTLISIQTAIERVQALVRATTRPGPSVVDELIADRRREAAREEAGD